MIRVRLYWRNLNHGKNTWCNLPAQIDCYAGQGNSFHDSALFSANTCVTDNQAAKFSYQVFYPKVHACFGRPQLRKEIKMKWKADDGGWSPYLAGALLGVLAIASVLTTTKLMGKTSYLGASTTFVRAAGLMEQTIAEGHVVSNEYFAKTKVRVDWQFMLVLGIVIGAFISSVMDRSFRLESVPPIWKERFGSSIAKRAVGAFVGGIIAMVGARLASGCPSGHGLSGMMQLSVSSLAALFMFFGVGVWVAHLVYTRRSL